MAAKERPHLAQARGLLEAAGPQYVSPSTRTRRRKVFARDLANALSLPPSVVQELMAGARLALSDRGPATDRITAFPHALHTHPAYAHRTTTNDRTDHRRAARHRP